MKQSSIIYIDGTYLKASKKTLETFTPGVFQGQGVFETMLAVGGKVFDVNLHLKRLKSAFPRANVSQKIIQKIVKENGFAISRVRILVWRQGRDQHVAVMALRYMPPQKKDYNVCVIKTNRRASSRVSNIKSLDYTLFANAYQRAHDKGFDEALLLNNKGYVFEASRSNVFWFKNGRLYTPPLSSGCLNGITRRQVIKHAQQLKVPVSEKNVFLEELAQADCVFLTNSLIGIMPVRKLSFKQAHRIS